MSVLLAILVGILIASGTWLVMQRRLLHLVLGIGMLGHGANLLIFAAGGVHAAPAFTPGGTPLPGAADPLPQALVLTAIVIGFGATAFLLALAWRAWRELGDDDLPGWHGSEPPLEDRVIPSRGVIEADDRPQADVRHPDAAARGERP